MNTVAQIAEERLAKLKRNPAQLTYLDTPEIKADTGTEALLSVRNERGTLEVLLAMETYAMKDELMSMKGATLTGFFRRRSSGWLADGTRHYIYTFCPTGFAVEELKAAA
jgi:hypothetical protein